MFSNESSAWAPLLFIPFGLVLYIAILLGVLWLATRVVRHAWYWQASSSSKTAADEDTSDTPRI